MAPPAADPDRIAVLSSGGADSAVLLWMMSLEYPRVEPLYIRCGLSWEEIELAGLRKYLKALAEPRIAEPVVLELPMQDVYADHWSITGRGVPDQATPDEAVYLPGRNLMLLAKAAVYCAVHGIGVIAAGQLKGNPFPDATPEFFSAMGAVAGAALGTSIKVITPLLDRRKHEVIAQGWQLPLEHSFSCMSPAAGGRHCGVCNKCFERRQAFAAAGVKDRTDYAA